MLKFRVAFISFICLGAFAAFAWGASANDQQKGRDKQKAGPKAEQSFDERAVEHGHGNGHASPRDERTVWRSRPDAWRDRERCVVVVHEYYDRRSLPPGLAKKHSLPPGLQKQLYERGHLPLGLEKHWVMLPEPLERELPPLPPHHARRIVGGDLLVVDLRLNVVVSLWKGVF
jgi:hypothetical protein